MRSVIHREFAIQRVLHVVPARASHARADPEAKRSWSACEDGMVSAEYSLDFQTGGLEINRLVDAGGVEHLFRGYYLDIVEAERIILYAYSMFLGARKLSASIVTVQFAARASQTEMTYTEQIAFLDGHQDPEDRIRGTAEGFRNLEQALRS